MKNRVLLPSLAVCLMLGSASGWAAVTSCETIKDKVAAKLDGKGVSSYTLRVVSKDTETKLRVVGTCDGGRKKITYRRGKSAGAKDDTAEKSEE